MEGKLKTVNKCCGRLKEDESEEKLLAERQTETLNYSVKSLPRFTKKTIGRLSGRMNTAVISDEKAENKLAVDREISVWKDIKPVVEKYEKKVISKTLSEDASKSDLALSSSSTPSSVMSSSCVLSVASLRWNKEQYEETTSAGFGTPPWDEAQRNLLPRTKIKLPKWTTEYFLKKPGVAESQMTDETKLESELSRPKIWSAEDASEAPAEKPDAADLLPPHAIATRDSIGSCSSLIATLAQEDRRDDDGQEEAMDTVREEVTEVIKLWPEDVIKVDYRDEGYEEDWDSDEIDREVEEIGRLGKLGVEKKKDSKKAGSIGKAGDLKFLERENEIGEFTPDSSDFAPIDRNSQVGQRDELRDGKRSTKIPQKDKMSLDEPVPIFSAKIHQRESNKVKGSLKEGEELELGNITERKQSDGDAKQAEEDLQLEDEQPPSESETYSGPSSYSISSGSTDLSVEWKASKKKKKTGLDRLFSSSGSKFSTSSSCASDLDLQLASSDSDRSRSESQKPHLREKSGPTAQLSDLGVQDEAAERGSLSDLHGAMQEQQPSRSSAAPQLEDFTPVFWQMKERLHAIATGKDPDAAELAVNGLQEMSPLTMAVPVIVVGRGPAGPPSRTPTSTRTSTPTPTPAPGGLKGRPSPRVGSRVSIRPGREAHGRRRARSALHTACDRWLGPWRRAYFDLFQGDVNVILRTKEGHFLVVDIKLLKTLDLFKMQIDAIGNENFLQKVHYLPQVTFSDTIRVLLWCSFMQDLDSQPDDTDDESIETEEESDEDEEPEKLVTPHKSADDEGDDASAESSDQSLDPRTAPKDSSKGSMVSRKTKKRSKRSIHGDASRLKRLDLKDSARDLAKEPKESRKRGSKKESLPRESARDLHGKASTKTFRKHTKAEREGSLGSRSRHSSKKLDVSSAAELRPEARAMLQALTASFSAGEVAQLAAAADALGAPTLWRGLMRDLARHAGGRRLASLQMMLDPTLQAKGLGQILCYARATMDEESLQFRQFEATMQHHQQHLQQQQLQQQQMPTGQGRRRSGERSTGLAGKSRKGRAKKKP